MFSARDVLYGGGVSQESTLMQNMNSDGSWPVFVLCLQFLCEMLRLLRSESKWTPSRSLQQAPSALMCHWVTCPFLLPDRCRPRSLQENVQEEWVWICPVPRGILSDGKVAECTRPLFLRFPWRCKGAGLVWWIYIRCFPWIGLWSHWNCSISLSSAG